MTEGSHTQMWKKFQFFDRSAVYDGAEGPGGEGKSFIQGLNVTCCTSGRSKVGFLWGVVGNKTFL